MSGGQGMGIVVVAAALGALASLATKHEPGSLLGGFVIAGTLVAGFAVRRWSAYLLIPVPALSYLVFALAVGLLQNQSTPSSSGLTVSAAQWVANGFVTMIAATVVAAAITVGRWFWGRRTGVSGDEAGPRPQGPGGRRRREAPAAWEARPEPEPRPRPGDRPDPEWSDDRWDPRGSGDWSDPRGRGGYGRERDGGRAEWDRLPPPGPPSFGSPRDLAAGGYG